MAGGDLDNATGLRRSLDLATAAATNLTRELGPAARSGTSARDKYLQFGDERLADAMKGVITARKPGEATDEPALRERCAGGGARRFGISWFFVLFALAIDAAALST
jgi:hypothetical protein